MRLLKRALTSATVLATLTVGTFFPTQAQASTASAAPRPMACPLQGAHHVRFVTAVSYGVSHDCGAPDPAVLYQGWIGINGQIMTPAKSALLWDPSRDLAMGSIAMVRYGADGKRIAWIRMGWYTGTHPSCGTAENRYELFVEISLNGTRVKCTNVSPLAMGGSVIYRIQRDPVHDCWTAYYNYDKEADSACDMPVAMTAEVSNFLQNISGESLIMPRTVFGADNPNTNAAVRLMGANGYQPWDTTLSAGATFVQDERLGGQYTYTISAYAPFYHAQALGG